jgi:hypothetical protein
MFLSGLYYQSTHVPIYSLPRYTMYVCLNAIAYFYHLVNEISSDLSQSVRIKQHLLDHGYSPKINILCEIDLTNQMITSSVIT